MPLFEFLKIKAKTVWLKCYKEKHFIILENKNGKVEARTLRLLLVSSSKKTLIWNFFKREVRLEIIKLSGKGKCKHCCVACTLWPVTLGRNIEHSGLGNGMLWLTGQFQN